MEFSETHCSSDTAVNGQTELDLLYSRVKSKPGTKPADLGHATYSDNSTLCVMVHL